LKKNYLFFQCLLKIANFAVIMEKEIQNIQNELLEIKVSLTDALERIDALLLATARCAQRAEREPVVVDEPNPEPIAAPVCAPIAPSEADESEPAVAEPDVDDDVEEEIDEVDEDEPTSVPHHGAASIVFTLNDRFRFRRELFGNSEAEMADTVNLLSAMSSMSEVEDYLLNDLEWDADNQEVQDFMAIVARKFTDRPPLLG
jgi:hypothetical protein